MLEFILELGAEILFDSIFDIVLSVIPKKKHSERLEQRMMILVSGITLLFLVLFCVGIYMSIKTEAPNVVSTVFLLLLPIQLALSTVIYVIRKLISVVKRVIDK